MIPVWFKLQCKVFDIILVPVLFKLSEYAMIRMLVPTYKASIGESALHRRQHLFVHPVPGVVVGCGLVPGSVHVDRDLFAFTSLVIRTSRVQDEFHLNLESQCNLRIHLNLSVRTSHPNLTCPDENQLVKNRFATPHLMSIPPLNFPLLPRMRPSHGELCGDFSCKPEGYCLVLPFVERV